MKSEDRPYAEDVNFWKTGKGSPDSWIEKAIRQIEALGGEVEGEGFMGKGSEGAYMLGFHINGDQFRMQWPVLESKTGDNMAARRQAATMLYHTVKMKCLAARVLGAKAAFMESFLLPNGKTVLQLTDSEQSAAGSALIKALEAPKG